MAEIGDRLVAVLKVVALEKTLRIVRAYPVDGLADGIGGAAVARQGIGALLRRHGRDGNDSFGQTAMIAVCSDCESREFTKTLWSRAMRTVPMRTREWTCTAWKR